MRKRSLLTEKNHNKSHTLSSLVNPIATLSGKGKPATQPKTDGSGHVVVPEPIRPFGSGYGTRGR